MKVKQSEINGSVDRFVTSVVVILSSSPLCGLSGCEECSNANPTVCLKHGPLHPIPNRPVMSKARASLPLVLYIDRFLGGVFSKRRIPKRTQFGPVEGPLVSPSELQDHYIHLKVNQFLSDGSRCLFSRAFFILL